MVGALAVCSWTRDARADEASAWKVGPRERGASVTVGRPQVYTSGRFARPPDPDPPLPSVVTSSYARPYDVRSESEAPAYDRDVYRAPFRLQVGPAAVTTGRGLGMGLGVAADFGRSTVGARIAAIWTRGERDERDERRSENEARTSPLGTGLGQYTGELTLDLNKRGPVHPVLGVGFGVVHIRKPDGSGNAGIGIARLGLEYSIGLYDADVRLGGGITGALPGPADRELADLKAYAIVGANVAIGF